MERWEVGGGKMGDRGCRGDEVKPTKTRTKEEGKGGGARCEARDTAGDFGGCQGGGRQSQRPFGVAALPLRTYAVAVRQRLPCS